MPPLDDPLQRFLRAGAAPYRARLEDLLAELDEADADAWMMLIRESRGAAALLAGADGERALFVGDGRSGGALALAALGLRVVMLDRDPARLRFGLARAEAYEPGSSRAVLGGGGPRLPFADGAFDLVVVEDGLPGPATGWGFGMDEVRRVSRGEVIVAADNRLGYKRSTGRRGVFRRSPLHLLRESLRPGRGERTLATTRAVVRGGWERADAFALYPHRREFSHVVALDAPLPRLSVGPRERRNRVKVAAQRVGLFRWLTPSFVVRARRGHRGPSRVDALLGELAERLGEEAPTLELLVATRSNNALLLTTAPDGAPGWAVHVPLQPVKRAMVRAHHRWMQHVAARYPGVPVPEPLFAGRAAGLEVAVARRLAGLDGTEVTGDLPRTARMLEDAARLLPALLDDRPTPLDDARWDGLVEERFARVLAHVRGPGTRRAVTRMARELGEVLRGRALRLGMYHADLRPKHVKLGPDGALRGLMDWGASEGSFLPLVDLAQLVLHQRSQERGGRFGEAWRSFLDPAGRRPHERRALELYAGAAGLAEDEVEAILRAFPLFVAGMAERNWDYSRPHWVARQFGL